MGIKDAIVSWLLDNVRVPSAVLVDVINEIDTDKDGYISLREVYVRVKDR